MEKTLVEIGNVGFDRNRFRRYYGNIGEMVAEEFLVRRRFDVCCLRRIFQTNLLFEKGEV